MCHGTAETRRQFLAPMARGNVIRPRKLVVVMSLCAVTICLVVIASLHLGQGQHAFFVSPSAPPRRESTRGKRLTGGPVTVPDVTRHPRLFVGVVERQLENRATGVVERNSTTVVKMSQHQLSVDQRNTSVTGENTLVKGRGQIVDGGDFLSQTHTGDQQGVSPTNSPGRLSVKRWQISASLQKLFHTSAPVRTFLYPGEARERSNLHDDDDESNNDDRRETDDDLDANYDGQHVNGNQHHVNVIHLTGNDNEHHGNGKDDEHNRNEDKELHKEDEKRNKNEDKEPYKEDEKHNRKEDKEAHTDDKHNGNEEKEPHKKDEKHNGNENTNPHKHDDKNNGNEYTLRTDDDENHTNEDRHPTDDDKRAGSENRRKNVTYETLWEDHERPTKGSDYYGQEHQSPNTSGSERARMDDVYLLEDGGQPIPNYDHGDYIFDDVLASEQQYSYVLTRHDPKYPRNVTEKIRILFPPIRHLRFGQPASAWKKYQSANAMGSEKGLSIHRWLDRLLNVSYWRSASAGHSADFAGDLPLFLRCRSGLAPGPYGYIKRPNYLKNSKNPCWAVGARPMLACIPDFYLVGISKSGTSHLYHRLAEHTDVVHGSVKEPKFFSRTRFLENGKAFRRYTGTYRALANEVQRDLEEKGFSEKITGDGSPSYFFDNSHWRLFSGNEGCTEPRVLIAHHILHLHPKAKVIIIYRDPVERLYSRYLYFCGNYKMCTNMGYLSPQSFHDAVMTGVFKYLDCLLRWSLRHCVYNTTLAASVNAALRFQESLYPVLLEDWLRIVPRQQMHVIQFERYVANEEIEIQHVYSFLGLKPQANTTRTTKRWRNPGKFYNVGPMLPQTRTLLRTFFQPFMRRFELMLRHNGLLRSSHSDLDGRGRIAE